MNSKLKKLRNKQRKAIKQSALTMTINEIVAKLLKIFRKHIGEGKKISRRKLFTKVYDAEPEFFSDLQEFMMWELIRKAMHRCRQQTKAFIVSKFDNKVWSFWVVKEINDFYIYRDNINRSIKAMRAMVGRCEKAVEEGWHSEDWASEWNKKHKKVR